MRVRRSVFVIVLICSLFFSTCIPLVYASSTWTQSNWAGGSGQTTWADATKYSFGSNIVDTIANQLTISSQSNWYDTSWKYRQSVSVTNSSDGALSEYQIPIFLNTSTLVSASKMNSDCSDLRVTDASNNLLSYWIATSPSSNTCNQTTTKIWVKATSIPTTGLSLYLYYGNTSASAVSNGSNVFAVFADFTSGSALPTNWTKTDVGTSGTTTVGSGSLSITNTNGEDIWENIYGGTHAYNQTKVSGSFVAEALVTSQTNTDPWAKSGIMAANNIASGASNGQSFIIVTPGNGVRFQYQDSAGGYIAANNNSLTGPSYSFPAFLKLTKDGSNRISGYFSTNGSSWTQEGSTVTPLNVATDQYVALFITPHSLTATGTATYTFFYIRKYSATEPSVGSPGSEETPFSSSGNIISSILDTGESSTFGTLNYTATVPTNTSVSVKIRASNKTDMADAPDFNSCSAITSGSVVSSNTCSSGGNRYLQYQVTLTSTDKTVSPIFQRISIEYSKDNPSSPTSTGGSSCAGDKPSSIPDLFQVDTTEQDATVYFTPISNASTYYISFSTKPSAEEHGVEAHLGSDGVQSYVIHLLSPNTTYYMKVRGQNGCTPGEWSGIRKVQTKGVSVPSFEESEEPPPEEKEPEKPISEETKKQPEVLASVTKEEPTVPVTPAPVVPKVSFHLSLPQPDMGKYMSQTKIVTQAFATTLSHNLFILGERLQNISAGVGYMLVDAGYRLIDEPTYIADVQTTVLSPTSVQISWKTNQPANGKINYGLDKTYGKDIQSEKRVTDHVFTIADLTPGETYVFEVMSQAKTYVFDANREFTTPEE